MVPDSVRSLYESLRSTISQFRSPAFRTYFLRKADEDFSGVALSEGGMARYLEEQGELEDILKRQTVIYNMFHDEGSRI